MPQSVDENKWSEGGPKIGLGSGAHYNICGWKRFGISKKDLSPGLYAAF